MRYIVIELQTYTDGSVGNIVSAYEDGNLAEQKFHTILAAAAVSELPAHAAVIMTSEGVNIKRQCYYHEIEPPEIVPPEDDLVEAEAAE